MVVFVMLVLSSSPSMDEKALRDLLDHALPNDTNVWRLWKKTVVTFIKHQPLYDRFPAFQRDPEGNLQEKEEQLLENLYKDAQTAHQAYTAHS